MRLNQRVKILKALAVGCSEREVSILAVAIEDLFVNKGVDAMTQLAVIQVDPFDSNPMPCME